MDLNFQFMIDKKIKLYLILFTEGLNVEQAFLAIAKNALAQQNSTIDLYNEFPDQIKLTNTQKPSGSGDSCAC